MRIIIEVSGGLVAAVYGPEGTEVIVYDRDAAPGSGEPEEGEAPVLDEEPARHMRNLPDDIAAAVAELDAYCGRTFETPREGTVPLLDTCPVCGVQYELTAWGHAPISYDISNSRGGYQNWERGEVDDACSSAEMIACRNCDSDWGPGHFTLDSGGNLVALGTPSHTGEVEN